MTSKPEHMKRSTLARSLAACFVLVLPLPLLAAELKKPARRTNRVPVKRASPPPSPRRSV